MIPFPENFMRLHQGEEFIRSKSVEAIEAADDLTMHAGLIASAMDLIDYFARHYPNESDDQLTIQCLGIRLFNGAASALTLLLSGYYQTSALQQRDLLETAFLLDYFRTNKALIVTWKMSDEKGRMKEFSPAKIRIFLDDRDGFTERKREEHYKLLCGLAGHPTYDGFRMLTPIVGGDAHCGPFFEEGVLSATLSELAKIVMTAGQAFTRFFEARFRTDHLPKIIFMEASGLWLERFYGQPFNRLPLDKMRASIERLPDRPVSDVP
jgi:hypothetical protein